jgi:hypothetical protein
MYTRVDWMYCTGHHAPYLALWQFFDKDALTVSTEWSEAVYALGIDHPASNQQFSAKCNHHQVPGRGGEASINN